MTVRVWAALPVLGKLNGFILLMIVLVFPTYVN